MKKKQKKTILIIAISLVVLTLLVVILALASGKKDKKDLPPKTDHEKVSIYIFRGDGCSHCQDAIRYFYNSIKPYNDYIEVKTYEVWKDTNNKSLYTDVAQKFGKEGKAVPFIVIGDKYYFEGYADNGGDLIKVALDEYENKEYKDLVKETLKEKEYKDVKMTTLKEAAIAENIATEDNSLFIMLGVFAVVVIGVGVFLVATKEN